MLSALTRALPVFASARVLSVVFFPLAAAAIAFVAIAWWTWTPLVEWAAVTLFDAPRGASGVPSGWGVYAAAIAAFLTFAALALVTALVAIAVLAMPMIVSAVAARDFATLERRRGGTFAGSVVNAVVTIAVFVPLWIVSLFLLAVPPLFVAVSLALSAWLNQRLLRYDALAEHADAGELRAIVRGARGRLFGLGLLLAPLSYVPIVNFFAPLYAGVAFAYLCLDELAARRAVVGVPIPE
ncbi:MAG: EI24 domain-containing protein, partial [Casimicrobiaceae bacterium]